MYEIVLEPEKKQTYEEDNLPPVLKTWKNIYLLVIGSLALQVIVYYLITKIFE